MISRQLSISLAIAFGPWFAATAGDSPGDAPAPVAAVPPGGTKGKNIAPEAAEFFEAKVRPVLAENCFQCHGAEKQKGGVRLDSLASLLKGNDGGPVVVAGAPDRSPMIRAVRRAGEIKMPPEGKLPDDAVSALVRWVEMGVPWPDAHGVPGTAATLVPAASLKETHWAFQPLRDPPVPAVKAASWASSPIDHFILAKLEEKGMRPSPRADRRALIRRVTFDLTGLPPAPDEVEAFAAGEAPDAFARLVDRLLASPRHGERWARHWLDVARYSDTKGYVFEEERRFPFSYTYRDYVIRSFNEDLPYDRFVIEQIAADLLPASEDQRAFAAMGFLTLGRRFLNQKPDIIDDRIDVVTRGFLGLTVTCARCHDHKYDPIPTADYYSLYGVFASANEPKEAPLIAPPEANEAYAEYEKELKKREAEVDKFLAEKHADLVAGLRKRAGEYLVGAVTREDKDAGTPDGELRVGNIAAGDLHPVVLRRWRRFLEEKARSHDRVLAPWTWFAGLKAEEFPARAAEVATRVAAGSGAETPINARIAAAFAGDPPASLKVVAERYGELLSLAEKTWQEALAAHQKAASEAAGDPPAAPTALADPALEEVRQLLYAEGTPPTIPVADARRFINRDVRGKLRGLQKKVEEWQVTSPGAPARAMSLAEEEKPSEPRIFIRGNARNPGEKVPRQFLAVLSGNDRKPFQNGSGRLELAQAIASPANPLTARVFVNRVWMHHFGAALVRTPGDFGVRCDPPDHPELLDHLASRFIGDGWSVKKLHRRILLSSAYQQASDDQPEYGKVDPDNRLLWRASRRRLEFEALRDAVLAASGSLDLTMGGRAADIAGDPANSRRTVYGYIERQNLPGLFRTFDFPNPDALSPQRYVTTVPQQALFLMNSPFLLDKAKKFAARPDVAARGGTAERVEALHWIAYGRAPDAEERALALRYLEKAGAPPAEEAWTRYAQVLLLANEFAYLD